MSGNRFAVLVAAAALFALFALMLLAIPVPSQSFAAAEDYRFELVGSPVKSGKITLIKVRLVHLPDGKPVAGAIIVQSKLDMSPEGMATMTAPAKAVGTPEAGIYQIVAEPAMGGNWALHLSAKVQGEPGTVNGTATLAIPK
ncbi:MAG TPA: FixH family protein [Stellaceae bacterium]|nr:FixH family protein [Stellaceae bacterium]